LALIVQSDMGQVTNNGLISSLAEVSISVDPRSMTAFVPSLLQQWQWNGPSSSVGSSIPLFYCITSDQHMVMIVQQPLQHELLHVRLWLQADSTNQPATGSIHSRVNFPRYRVWPALWTPIYGLRVCTCQPNSHHRLT
jgi:hypothetical protein